MVWDEEAKVSLLVNYINNSILRYSEFASKFLNLTIMDYQLIWNSLSISWQDWKPRYGYKRTADVEDKWLIELPVQAGLFYDFCCASWIFMTLLVFPILQFLFFVYFNPLYFILDSKEDQFEKLNKDKKERIAKNELQRLRNIARNKKGGENFGSCYLLQVMIPLLVYGIQAAYYWKVNKILAVIFILNIFKWMNIVFKYFLLWF